MPSDRPSPIRTPSAGKRSWPPWARSSGRRTRSPVRWCSRVKRGSARRPCGEAASRQRSTRGSECSRLARWSPSRRSPSRRSLTSSERTSTTSSRRFLRRSAVRWRSRCCSASQMDLRRTDGPWPSGSLAHCERSGTPDPVLLALDDLHWLDGPSANALEYALRRLRDEPIAVLAANRVPHRPALDLVRVFDTSRVQRVRVGPLSLGAIGRVLRQRLDLALPRPAPPTRLRGIGWQPIVRARDRPRAADPFTRARPRGASAHAGGPGGAAPRPHPTPA